MSPPRAVRDALDECPAEPARIIRGFIDDQAERLASARTVEELATLLEDSKDALQLTVIGLGSFQSQEAAIVERLDELKGIRSVTERAADHIDRCLTGIGKVLGEFSVYHWVALILALTGIVSGTVTYADLWHTMSAWLGATNGG